MRITKPNLPRGENRMDKNMKEQNIRKENIFCLLKLLIIFILFVISAFFNETLGMLMFGVLVLYLLFGNHNYKVKNKDYEENIYSKRELLNYDKKDNESEDAGLDIPHKKLYLITIGILFVLIYLGSYIRMELGMLFFGVLVFYILGV